MLGSALLVLPVMTVPYHDSLFLSVALIALAAAAHCSWSANIFTVISDLFPTRVVGSVTGFATTISTLGGMVTALPLLLFTTGARKIHFSTIGILQYIAPSCTFLLAVFVYREPFRTAQLWTFIMIWTALLLYSIDSVVYFRRHHLPRR